MSRLKIFVEAQSFIFGMKIQTWTQISGHEKTNRKKEAENSRWISGIFPTRRQQ